MTALTFFSINFMRTHLLLVLLAAAAFLPSALVAQPSQASPFRIGLIFPLSGEYARFGIGAANASKLAAQEGSGYPVSLLFEDNRTCAAADAVGAYHKLRSVDKVQAVVTFCTAAAKAVLPMAKADKVLVFQLTEPGVPGDTYMIKMMPQSTAFLDVLAEIFSARYARMAVIANTMEVNTSPNGNIPLFVRAFEKRGGVVTFSEDFPSDILDFRTLISKLKNSNAQAVIPFIWDPKQMAVFLEQSDQLSLWSRMELAGNFVFEMMFNDLVKLYPKLTQRQGLVSVNFKQTTSDAFVARYRETFGEAPPQFSDYAFDVVEMIRRCGLNRECLIKPHQGASGRNEFGPDGRREGEFILKELRDGEFKVSNIAVSPRPFR